MRRWGEARANPDRPRSLPPVRPVRLQLVEASRMALTILPWPRARRSLEPSWPQASVQSALRAARIRRRSAPPLGPRSLGRLWARAISAFSASASMSDQCGFAFNRSRSRLCQEENAARPGGSTQATDANIRPRFRNRYSARRRAPLGALSRRNSFAVAIDPTPFRRSASPVFTP